MLRVGDFKKVLQSKFLKVNSIFNILKTSRKNELAFCGYNGFYFGTLKRKNKDAFELNMSATEFYLQEKYI